MGWLLSLLGGLPAIFTSVSGAVTTVSNNISNEKIALMTATTDREKIETQERINALQATRDVLIAETAKSKIPMYMQVLMTAPWVAFLAKAVIWDKMLGWGSTPTLLPEEWYLCYMIYGFWFVHTTVGLFKK